MILRKFGATKRAIIIIVLGRLLNTSLCEARLDGIPYVEIEVKGETYEVPVINAEAKNELYYLKKALGGDKMARQIFLGGKDERTYFLGDGDFYGWLRLTADDEWVVKGKGEQNAERQTEKQTK